jgi:hypothetical protein
MVAWTCRIVFDIRPAGVEAERGSDQWVRFGTGWDPTDVDVDFDQR